MWCWTQTSEADELGLVDGVDVDGTVVRRSSSMQVYEEMEIELMHGVD